MSKLNVDNCDKNIHEVIKESVDVVITDTWIKTKYSSLGISLAKIRKDINKWKARVKK